MNTTIDTKKAKTAAVAVVEIGFAVAVVITALISAGVLLFVVGAASAG